MDGLNKFRLFSGDGAHALKCNEAGDVFVNGTYVATIVRSGEFFLISLEDRSELSDLHGMAKCYGRNMYEVSAFCAIVVSVNQHGKPVVNIHPQAQTLR